MICNKTNNDIDWRILEDNPHHTQDIIDPVPTIPISSTLIPRCSERVAKQLDRFMYLGKSFEAILKEHKIDPIVYDEAMSDVDAHLWQKAIEAKLESLRF